MKMDNQTMQLWANKALRMQPWPPPHLFPPSPYYRFLQVLAQETSPALSVELGVCGGGGSLHLAAGCRGGKVVGVDKTYDHPEQLDYIKYHYRNFVFWLGDSVEDAKQIYEHYGLVNILFIDTVHTYEQTVKEFNAWLPYLASGAVVCFDDLFRPGMVDAWDEIKAANKLRIDNLHDGAVCGGGFGVMWGF